MSADRSYGVEGLTVTFGDTTALSGVSVAVEPGQVVGVIGGDGAGKSTLLSVLAHGVAPAAGTVRSLPAADLGYEPSSSGVWPNLTVDENVRFVGRAYSMSDADVAARAADLLDQAGLSGARDRLGRNLSGGMRQKLGFVLAMLHSPALLLLDEPTTGVDPVSRVDLWRLISEAASRGAAVLMSTTYVDEAQRAASVLALNRGTVIAQGDPAQVIAGLPGTIETVPLDTPDVATSWRRGSTRHAWVPAGAPAQGPAARHVDLDDALIALTLQADSGSPQAEAPPITAHRVSAPPTGSILAEGSGVTRRFGSMTAVDDVSLSVRAGEIVGLIGANGAGKTTFLRCLIGLDRPTNGTVRLFGGSPSLSTRARMGYVPQGLGLYQTLSVRQNVEFYGQVYGTSGAQLPPSLEDVLGAPVSSIGLGRQRQLAFALALSHSPDLLVLDEPTSGVDPLARARLWDTIHNQAASGTGVIVSTHYMQEADQCDRLALLSHGRMLGLGTVDELTKNTHVVAVRSPRWQDAFDALSDAGLPTMLDGRDVRVAGESTERVKAALGSLEATVTPVAATLEETMLLLDQPQNA